MHRLLLSIPFFTCLLVGCTASNSDKIHNYQAEVFNAKWITGEFESNTGMFYLAGEQGSIIWSTDGNNWHYSQTPVTHALYDIAIDPSQNVMMAVGEGGTILRSTDKGKAWKKTELIIPETLGIFSPRLNTISYSSKFNVWLAAGTQNTILRSSDNGLTWELVSYNARSNQLEILELFVEEQSGDILFAAQYGTTGRSSDGGANWKFSKHDMDVTGRYIPHIVGFHQFNNTLIAAADHGRLLISKNAGHTWKLTKTPTAGYFTDSAYDPKYHVIALTTQMGEIVISKDEAETWELIDFKINNWPSDDIPLFSNIVYDETSHSLLIIGNSGVIARSEDGGQSWFADIYKPLFNMSVTTLLHDANKNIFITAGSGGFIAYAKKLGAPSVPLDNWTLVRPGIDQYIRKVAHLRNSNTFVAVGQLGSILRSEDDGYTWEVIDVAYPYMSQPPHLRDILEDSESKALIAAGPTGSIIRSTDAGLSWTPVFQGELRKGEAFTQLLYNSKSKAYLACEVLYRSVYRSVDNGLSWRKISTIDSGGRNLWHGAVSDNMNLSMVLGEKGGIAISRNGGVNWKMAKTNTTADLYGAYADDERKVLLGVGENGIIIRSENGTDWESVDSGTSSTLRRIFKDPSSGALIAFGQEGSILRSTDSGLHWSYVKTPTYFGELRTAFVESDGTSLAIVGRDGAILRSTDSGVSWKHLSSHTKQHFRSAAINPETGTIIGVGQGLVRLAVIPN